MEKSFIRKPISILLSLLMLLSVFGGMAFPAAAEDVTWTDVTSRTDLVNAIADGAEGRRRCHRPSPLLFDSFEK